MASSPTPSPLTATEREDRRARWAAALIAGRQEEIDEAFAADGASPPRVIWSPKAEDLRTEPCRFLLGYWNECRGDSAIPPMRAIDPAAMRRALGYVLLVDVVDGGRDFRYRVYGSLIATVSGTDLTGRLMTEHHASDYVIDFSVASGRAVMARHEAFYSLRHPARTDFTRSWERLMLPLADESGAATRFLIGNVPIDRAGEVLRPRF